MKSNSTVMETLEGEITNRALTDLTSDNKLKVRITNDKFSRFLKNVFVTDRKSLFIWKQPYNASNI